MPETHQILTPTTEVDYAARNARTSAILAPGVVVASARLGSACLITLRSRTEGPRVEWKRGPCGVLLQRRVGGDLAGQRTVDSQRERGPHQRAELVQRPHATLPLNKRHPSALLGLRNSGLRTEGDLP
jgi:hypothetical protein